MSTIAKTSPECQQHFQDLKFKDNYQGIIFKINKESSLIVVDKTLSAGSDYSELLNSLPEDECRIIVYKYKIANLESATPKLYFIYYGPEKSTQEDRVIYGNSKVTFCITLKGIDYKISASNKDELSEKVLIERATPKTN